VQLSPAAELQSQMCKAKANTVCPHLLVYALHLLPENKVTSAALRLYKQRNFPSVETIPAGLILAAPAGVKRLKLKLLLCRHIAAEGTFRSSSDESRL